MRGMAVIAAAAAALAIGVVWWRVAGPSRALHSNLNLLLVTLDTTRADSMGAYGASDAATPTFDRIARAGVLFDQAITAAPLTLPAHSSIFTARYPPAHGVRDNGGFFLDDRETTLAERLKASGFRTGGFVGAYVLDRRWGIAQGFDTYFDEFNLEKAKGAALATVERPGNEVVDRALAWLDQAASSRFFAWVHLYDAHSPYEPPEPYGTRFAAKPYAGEVAFADSQVGRLVAFLESRRLLDRTVVAVVGDHGESLGEHGESTHGFFVYQSVLHVPLAILAPDQTMRGRRVRDTVRSVDLAPTLLELLHVPLRDQVDGRSLVSLMAGRTTDLGADAYSEAMYPRFHFGWSELRSITSGRYKFISAPRPELYDLQDDPGEAHNLYDARRTLADRMADALRAFDARQAGVVRRPDTVDPDVRARLAALGYVGTFVSADAQPSSALADPKDKIELFNLMTDAREKLQDDREAPEGVAMLERVAARDPEVIDAWLLLGNEHAKRGRYEAALAAFRRALQLKPDYDLALRNMANVYRDMGRPLDAATGLQRLLGFDPNNLQARQELAEVLLDAGRIDEAERELNTVLRRDPHMAAAHATIGALKLKRGDASGAEQEIRAALAERPGLRLAHFNLALAAEQRGDTARAIAEYRDEIAQHPRSYMAQFNLGKVYERSGDTEAQRRAWEDAIASNPRFAEGHLFLAKLYLDRRDLPRAEMLARKGLDLAPSGEWAPLGHFVLADVAAARGRRDEAARERDVARRLAARSKG